MKKSIKAIIGIIAVALLVARGFFANYMIYVNRYQDAISNMTYENTDASSIPDGT